MSRIQPPPYPNAPVQEVVFEIRFPGEPAIECKRDLFFDRVRNEFPEVHVPRLEPSGKQAVALLPYHFKAADHSRSILTALNLFAFSSEKYPGFESFRAELLRWLGEFTELFPVKKLTRVGLRYINRIPILPSASITDLLRVAVIMGETPKPVRNLGFGLQMPTPTGVLSMSLYPAPEAEKPQVVLDFDYAKTEGLSIDLIEQYLDESHDETKKLFESLLTDRYRAYLRGEAFS